MNKIIKINTLYANYPIMLYHKETGYNYIPNIHDNDDLHSTWLAIMGLHDALNIKEHLLVVKDILPSPGISIWVSD